MDVPFCWVNWCGKMVCIIDTVLHGFVSRRCDIVTDQEKRYTCMRERATGYTKTSVRSSVCMHARAHRHTRERTHKYAREHTRTSPPPSTPPPLPTHTLCLGRTTLNASLYPVLLSSNRCQRIWQGGTKSGASWSWHTILLRTALKELPLRTAV